MRRRSSLVVCLRRRPSDEILALMINSTLWPTISSGLRSKSFLPRTRCVGGTGAMPTRSGMWRRAFWGTVTEIRRGMATLAFGQMAYSYVFEAPIFGGDDGLGGISRLDLSFIGVDLNDSRSFAFFCLAILGAVYGASVLILRSGLGRSLTGVMLPSSVIALLAGLALLQPILKFTAAMMASEDAQAGLLTFIFTASGVSLFGIGAAFWGVVAGIVFHFLTRFGRWMMDRLAA